MKLNKHQIEQLIPHSGSMCLIDQVDSWDNNNIQCTSNSHRELNNPLRFNGELSSLHLLEYGAQTMAIHGGLLNNSAIPGFLASVRNVRISIDRLDDVKTALTITARAQINTESGVIYEFSITDANANLLLKARATVINR